MANEIENKKEFKGIMQYTRKQFEIIDPQPGVLYFVRDVDENNESTGNAEIYFGGRKYSDTGAYDIKCKPKNGYPRIL